MVIQGNSSLCIEDARVVISIEIGGHDFVLGVFQYTWVWLVTYLQEMI